MANPVTPGIRRGPRLATKALLMAVALLSIPWLGYNYLSEMKSFLVQGQANALLLTAQGMATLLHGSEELFGANPTGAEQLAVYPLDQAPRIDGHDDDWLALAGKRSVFGSEAGTDGAFKLRLGVHQNHLYALVEIQDTTPVLRHPGYLRLDNSDHLRLSYRDTQGQIQRLLLSIEGEGSANAFHMDANWRYAREGQPEYRLQAAVRQVQQGYMIEWRLPLTLLDQSQRLGIAYADVVDARTRAVAGITGTHPQQGGELNVMLLRSPTVERLLLGLDQGNARVWVLDGAQRVRATAGQISSGSNITPLSEDNASYLEMLGYSFQELLFQRLIDPNAGAFEDFDPQLTQYRHDDLIAKTLAGTPSTQYRPSLDGRARIISAAYPIEGQGEIIGAVLLEQSADSVLAMQRASLERVVFMTLIALVLVFAALLLFFARLAWRIHRLRSEARAAVDDQGRLLVSELSQQVRAADEVGDLARGISSLLGKLHQYQEFIAQMPRTLRHEINNPLNTISTSLQQLEQHSDAADRRRSLQSAQRGLQQIENFMQQLAESASLEQALAVEQLEPLNLRALLDQYLQHFRAAHPHQDFVFDLADENFRVLAADLRIEQLLDKLLENAIDFDDGQAPIRVSLWQDGHYCHIEVANSGPRIDPERLPMLFDSPLSLRGSAAGCAHMGLGLYVARIITQFHHGQIRAINTEAPAGVMLQVSLPLLK